MRIFLYFALFFLTFEAAALILKTTRNKQKNIKTFQKIRKF
jgi:hypothetical protein